MNFSFDNTIPIYIQLVEQLKLAIISGNLKPGERLLSVRELALKFKVNPNTMQRALTELERLKLIQTKRTNGKYVTTDDELIKKYKEEYARAIAEDFLAKMESVSFTKTTAIAYLKELGGDKE